MGRAAKPGDSMLPQAETLETIAEISAALAGFAALAGVIGDRLDASHHARSFQRLRLVVIIAILFVVLSLLPIVVADFGGSVEAVWRGSSIVALFLNALTLYSTMRSAIEAGIRLDEGLIAWAIWPLEAISQLSLLANVFLIFPAIAGSLYLVYLLAGLCQAGVTFLLLLDETIGAPGR
jgi:hypothetical protein